MRILQAQLAAKFFSALTHPAQADANAAGTQLHNVRGDAFSKIAHGQNHVVFVLRQSDANRRSGVDQRTTRHPGYAVSHRKRKRVEQSFGWMKMVGMLKKVKLRAIEKVGWLFTFTGAAYNLCRLRNLMAKA